MVLFQLKVMKSRKTEPLRRKTLKKSKTKKTYDVFCMVDFIMLMLIYT